MEENAERYSGGMAQNSPVIDHFRTEISLGRLVPGQRLPPEPRLCEQLDVSRGALREALRELQGYGLIEVRHGSGTYVSSLQPSELLKGLAFTVDVVPLDGLFELLSIRRTLEAEAAAQTATAASGEVLAQLEALVEEMVGAESPPEEQKLDEQFHALICETAGNRSAATITAVIRSRSRHYDLVDNPEARAEGVIGHRAVLDAVRTHDSMGAWAAMHAHITSTERWLRSLKPPPH
ncbi:FadR/GntR family transcriptional regulator [Brevibacterium salitolerans]|uniref:FadR/GntR family transcriptional regulator n=2 Tax=Brevibacteriaceae TaxID=85019 RepID=A0ABN2WL59_9MICO